MKSRSPYNHAMKVPTAFLFLMALAWSGKAGAQTSSSSSGISSGSSSSSSVSSEMQQTQGAYWSVCFGGNAENAPYILLRLNSVTSVSKQRYLLNGTMSVWELSIDTTGNNAIRIYYIETPGSGSSSTVSNVSSAVSRLGGSTYVQRAGLLNGAECVTKTYPESTHAHTVEFRVKNVEALNNIQKSLMRCLSRGKGDTLTLPSSDCPDN
ncbi:MAG: hypothetical protein LUE08_07405 [Akkermansiaceae bacterium]|nr:hypothetical protein [Akkermansiaceae bacterium]